MSNRPTDAEKWHETHHSIIFQPPGEVPQTKGPWTSIQPLEEMLDHLEKQEPEGTIIWVVDSLCGSISVTSVAEYRMMKQAFEESWAALEEYKRIGKCSSCGACSAREAETKCRPTQYPSGEYGCAGEDLWENDSEDDESSEDSAS